MVSLGFFPPLAVKKSGLSHSVTFLTILRIALWTWTRVVECHFMYTILTENA